MFTVQDIIRYIMDKEFNSMLDQPGGVAVLDSNGKVALDRIPSMDHLYPRLVVSRVFSNTDMWDLSDVALEEGVYQLYLNAADVAVDAGDIWLLPNGAAYTNGFSHSNLYWTASNKNTASFERINRANAFCIGSTSVVHGLIFMSTYGSNKRLIALSAANMNHSMNLIASWNDTAVPWSTLGTVLFPAPTSGIVGLRRLV